MHQLEEIITFAKAADTLDKRRAVSSMLDAAHSQGVGMCDIAEAVGGRVENFRGGIRLDVASALASLYPPLKAQTPPTEKSADETRGIKDFNLDIPTMQVDTVLVPPDLADLLVFGQGEGHFEKAQLIPRTQYLLEVLNDLNVDLNYILIIEGKITDTMLRQTTYSLVKVPQLERMVLVCDEEGNRTFVIKGDLDAADSYHESTKAVLKQIAREDDTNVQHFVWTNEADFKTRMAEILTTWPQREGPANRDSYVENHKLPQADEEGVLNIDGKIYRTINALRAVLGLSQGKITNTVNDLYPKRGLDSVGKECDFYDEDEVRGLLKEFLALPQADEEGVLNIDGKIYRTTKGLAALLGISATKIKDTIHKNSLRPERGRNSMGNKCYFYDEDEVRGLLKEFLALPKAEEEEILTIDDKIYRTIYGFSKLFGVHPDKIENITKDLYPKKGRNSVGKECDFYDEDEVRGALKEFLALPQADEEGVLTIDGKAYRTTRSLAELLNTTHPRVGGTVKDLHPKRGRDSGGNARYFYDEDEVRGALKEFLALPQADEEGVLTIDGKTYRTTKGLAALLGISAKKIKDTIHKNGLRLKRGLDSVGKECDFYDEDEVREPLKEFLALPQANEEGVLTIDGKIYRTIYGFSKLFRINSDKIGNITKDLYPKRGRDSGGKESNFYDEDEVRALLEGKTQ